jgi:hypothetical protein
MMNHFVQVGPDSAFIFEPSIGVANEGDTVHFILCVGSLQLNFNRTNHTMYVQQ